MGNIRYKIEKDYIVEVRKIVVFKCKVNPMFVVDSEVNQEFIEEFSKWRKTPAGEYIEARRLSEYSYHFGPRLDYYYEGAVATELEGKHVTEYLLKFCK